VAELEFAAAAAVQLVILTAIRSGGESYAREHGTRGATTLLKSNLVKAEAGFDLTFTAKGGRKVLKTLRDKDFNMALGRLLELPGRRLFQYRDELGAVRPLRASDVNVYLRRIAGCRISLKDFRTLVASAAVLDTLVGQEPARSERGRRSQVRAAVVTAAEELANTPTICRTSYVHESIVAAFETGKLVQVGTPPRSRRKKAELLARVVRTPAKPASSAKAAEKS